MKMPAECQAGRLRDYFYDALRDSSKKEEKALWDFRNALKDPTQYAQATFMLHGSADAATPTPDCKERIVKDLNELQVSLSRHNKKSREDSVRLAVMIKKDPERNANIKLACGRAWALYLELLKADLKTMLQDWAGTQVKYELKTPSCEESSERGEAYRSASVTIVFDLDTVANRGSNAKTN